MIKKVIRHTAAFVTTLIPYNLLRKLADRDLVVVNYHSILNSDYDSEINKQPYRTAEQFDRDMAFFRKHYNIVNLKQITDHKKHGKKLPENSLAITFDDGLAQVYNLLRPILKKHSIPAIIFINPAFINQADMHFKRKINLLVENIKDNDKLRKGAEAALAKHNIDTSDVVDAVNNLNYYQTEIINEVAKAIGISFADYLKTHPLYLTDSEITTMIDEGFGFGGHSWDHPNYKEITIDEQIEQTIKSTAHTTNRYNLSYRVFAFPYRDFHVRKELFDKISSDIDLTFGTHGMVDDEIPFMIQRTDVERSRLDTPAAMKLNYIKFIVQKLTGKSFLKRR